MRCVLILHLDDVVLPALEAEPELRRFLGLADEARDWYSCGLAGREVVLVGRALAERFLGMSPHLDALARAAWFSSVRPTVPDGHGGWDICWVWLAPGPEDEHNPRAAAAFYGRVLGRVELPPGPSLPSALEPEPFWPLADTRAWPGWR
jgi:hypothetical protein